MLYKRSSFLHWLRTKHGCEITPMRNTRILVIEGKLCNVNLWADSSDLIDYEEIYLVCKKLHLKDLPGDKDLKLAE